jgi:hypothetical protein
VGEQWTDCGGALGWELYHGSVGKLVLLCPSPLPRTHVTLYAPQEDCIDSATDGSLHRTGMLHQQWPRPSAVRRVHKFSILYHRSSTSSVEQVTNGRSISPIVSYNRYLSQLFLNSLYCNKQQHRYRPQDETKGPEIELIWARDQISISDLASAILS